MNDLQQRLRRLELELLSTFEGGALQLEHARNVVAELEQLATLRAAGALHVDSSSSLALGMVCASLLFVVGCIIEAEQRRLHGSPWVRCLHVSRGALSPNGTRCTLRAGHSGMHVFGGPFPRQCDSRRELRCRLLQNHDGEHTYDDDSDERG